MTFLFAWRYFRSKKSTNAINIIAWITVLAMAVGTGALVIILSAFNGFESLVKSLYASFYPDLRVGATQQKIMLLDSAMLQRLQRLQGVAAVSLVVEENAHLQYGEYRANAVLKGVDAQYASVSGVQSNIVTGKYELGTDEQPFLVLGSGVEQGLGLLSDRSISPVTVYLPRRGVAATADPLAAISSVNMQAKGAFMIQQDFDNKYVITNLQTVKQMIGLGPDEYTYAEIKLQPGADEAEVATAITQLLGAAYLVENRYQQNRSLFSVMQLEKWAIYGILCLILVIAAFNMIGALTMLVLEKQHDIQILMAMGAAPTFIQRVFLAEGILLALLGSGLGTIVALLLCYLQVQFKLIPLEGAFVIDYYPVKVMPLDLLLVMLTVLLIAVLAAWLPSQKAARQQLSLKAQ